VELVDGVVGDPHGVAEFGSPPGEPVGAAAVVTAMGEAFLDRVVAVAAAIASPLAGDHGERPAVGPLPEQHLGLDPPFVVGGHAGPHAGQDVGDSRVDVLLVVQVGQDDLGGMEVDESTFYRRAGPGVDQQVPPGEPDRRVAVLLHARGSAGGGEMPGRSRLDIAGRRGVLAGLVTEPVALVVEVVGLGDDILLPARPARLRLATLGLVRLGLARLVGALVLHGSPFCQRLRHRSTSLPPARQHGCAGRHRRLVISITGWQRTDQVGDPSPSVIDPRRGLADPNVTMRPAHPAPKLARLAGL
jgi:hypothetical protein